MPISFLKILPLCWEIANFHEYEVRGGDSRAVSVQSSIVNFLFLMLHHRRTTNESINMNIIQHNESCNNYGEWSLHNRSEDFRAVIFYSLKELHRHELTTVTGIHLDSRGAFFSKDEAGLTSLLNIFAIFDRSQGQTAIVEKTEHDQIYPENILKPPKSKKSITSDKFDYLHAVTVISFNFAVQFIWWHWIKVVLFVLLFCIPDFLWLRWNGQVRMEWWQPGSWGVIGKLPVRCGHIWWKWQGKLGPETTKFTLFRLRCRSLIVALAYSLFLYFYLDIYSKC